MGKLDRCPHQQEVGRCRGGVEALCQANASLPWTSTVGAFLWRASHNRVSDTQPFPMPGTALSM